MIGDPPVLDGELKKTVIVSIAGVKLVIVGAVGTPTGVTAPLCAEAKLVPFAFTAFTVKV